MTRYIVRWAGVELSVKSRYVRIPYISTMNLKINKFYISVQIMEVVYKGDVCVTSSGRVKIVVFIRGRNVLEFWSIIGR